MTKIKICGIKTTADALMVAKYGVDYIGLVFAPGRRQVDVKIAREIVDAVRAQSDTVDCVGVFVNSPAMAVNRIADDCGLDCVQLSGTESWADCLEIRKPLIKTIHVPQGAGGSELNAAMEMWARRLEGKPFRLLLDAGIPGRYGGTGQTFNWTKIKNISGKYPLIIAGGLHPGNVRDLITQIHPWGVDVSSGAETNGIKDANKIKAFISAVKESDEKTI